MNKIYFKCPNCGKARYVSNSEDCRYEFHGEFVRGYKVACCACKSDSKYGYEDFLIVKKDEKSLLELFYKLNIKWGYDEIVWEKLEDRSWYLDAWATESLFLENDNIEYYSLDKRKDGRYDCWAVDRVLGYGEDYTGKLSDDNGFKTLEEAKQACEQDFQRRKASNEKF